MSIRRDLEKLLDKAAEEWGWRREYTGSGHWKIIHPSGDFFFTSSTPGDYRELKNTSAKIKRINRKNQNVIPRPLPPRNA